MNLRSTWHKPAVQWTVDQIRRSGREELLVLLSLCLLVGGIWAFVEITDEVLEGDTATFDEKILLAMRNPDDLNDPIGPRWMEEIGRDFTALGGMGVLTVLTAVVVGYLLLERRHRMAVFVLAAVIGGIGVGLLLKMGFSRPRPDLVPHESEVYTTSFPSGHSMMAAVTYLTLAALLARIQKRKRAKAYMLAVAILLTGLVGFSRVYVGVHWPTDVLAGWTAGAIWALLCGQVAWWLQRRGKIERPEYAKGAQR